MAETKKTQTDEIDEQKQAIEDIKPICFNYDNQDWTLEYNLAAVRVLESNYDFSTDDLERSKISKLPDLFFCAFLMHHSGVKRKTTDKIFSLMTDKERLFQQLVLLYYKAVNSILEEPDENSGEAIRW